MDYPSLEIDYDDVISYLFAICHPSGLIGRNPIEWTWNAYSEVLETCIGYAPQGLLSRLRQGKCDSTEDSECMTVLFCVLIRGHLPPTKDQRRSISKILLAENGHELTNHLLEDEEIGPILGRRLNDMLPSSP